VDQDDGWVRAAVQEVQVLNLQLLHSADMREQWRRTLPTVPVPHVATMLTDGQLSAHITDSTSLPCGDNAN
jgi:hypothetical protein